MIKGLSIEWPTLGMLALCHAGWAAAGVWLFPVSPLAGLAVMAVFAGFHTSLQHEALHGHPTRNAALNEFLVSLPLCVFYPYRRFRQMHLKHHHDERLTDPYDDPESWYRDRANHARLARPVQWLLEINNTLAGRVVIGPALMLFAFYRDEWGRFRRGEPGVRKAWLHHAAGLAALAVILEGWLGIPMLLYVPTVAYAGLSIIAIRTYCEHRWHEDPDGRTLIVENGGLLGLLFLNNNLHLVHHKLPRAPWYSLPRLYRAERERWRSMNGGYVVRSYRDIVTAYAFRRKEPVVHPAWPFAGRGRPAKSGAFHPGIPPSRPRFGNGAPVPAKPDRD